MAADEHFFNSVVRTLLLADRDSPDDTAGAPDEGEHAWLLTLASDEYRVKVEALFLTTGVLSCALLDYDRTQYRNVREQ